MVAIPYVLGDVVAVSRQTLYPIVTDFLDGSFGARDIVVQCSSDVKISF
jgi:hypothetical protein